ncbi:hypothetical protein CCUS01_13646, partial [Colletotrichum cuscutae]
INLPASLALTPTGKISVPRSPVGFTTLEESQGAKFPRPCGISLFYAWILEQSLYAESISTPFSSPHLSVRAR